MEGRSCRAMPNFHSGGPLADGSRCTNSVELTAGIKAVRTKSEPVERIPKQHQAPVSECSADDISLEESL